MPSACVRGTSSIKGAQVQMRRSPRMGARYVRVRPGKSADQREIDRVLFMPARVDTLARFMASLGAHRALVVAPGAHARHLHDVTGLGRVYVLATAEVHSGVAEICAVEHDVARL